MSCALPWHNVQLGPFEHWARHCPQNGLYRHYWFYSQLHKPGKDCFKCFILRTCNFGYRSHLLLYQKLVCCHFNMKFVFFSLQKAHSAPPDQWCGLRPSVLGQDRSETKKGLGSLSWSCRFCVVKHNLITLVVIMILEDTSAFQVLVSFLYFVLGTSLLWRSTVVFTYLKS